METTQKYFYIGMIGAALLAIMSSFYAGWKIQEWRYAKKLTDQRLIYEKQLADIDRVTNEKLRELLAKKQLTEEKLSAIEKKSYQELEDEKSKNNQLINDLSTANRKLWINTTSDCKTVGGGMSKATEAARMDNATSRANIDPRDAAAIIRITKRGDEAIRQLQACQQFFEEITK